jgi:hypothetical protein
MNIKQAMEYAQHADFKKETIAHMCRWQGQYCVFILTYEMITDEEPEDNGPRYSIEYVGSSLFDAYCAEGETYYGADINELTDDIIELISPDELKFRVYQHPVVSEVVPYIYSELLPEMMPDYDAGLDPQFYQHQVDRVLHYLNNTAA